MGLRSALSARLLEGRLSVVDRLEPEIHKTAEMAKALEKMKLWSNSHHSREVKSEEEADINDGTRFLLVEGCEVSSYIVAHFPLIPCWAFVKDSPLVLGILNVFFSSH